MAYDDLNRELLNRLNLWIPDDYGLDVGWDGKGGAKGIATSGAVPF